MSSVLDNSTPEERIARSIRGMLKRLRELLKRRLLHSVSREFEHWQLLAECVPDLILMVDLQGQIVFANRGRGIIPRAQLLGRPLTDLYETTDVPVVEQNLQEVLRRGSSCRLEVGGFSADNAPAWYAQRLSPVIRELKVVGVLLVETDITQHRRISAQLETERAHALQSAKLAALGEMAGGVAHEINTPLATIQILASMLKDIAHTGSISVQEVTDAASRIEMTVGRVAKIVRGLKAFSRDSSHDPYIPIAVSTLVEETLDLTRERLLQSHIDLRLGLIEPHLRIECRPAQIAQILMNVIGNAMDAIALAPEKWIAIEVADLGEHIEISISDSGPGVAKEVRTKIMQPFFTTKPVGQGTGLGLSVSMGLAQMNNGRFYLDEQCASRFVLSLPKRQRTETRLGPRLD